QAQGRRRVPGERWHGGPCRVCQCLPSLAVRCSPYCPHHPSACPRGQVLVQGRGDSCCYCAPMGESGGASATVGGVLSLHGGLVPPRGSYSPVGVLSPQGRPVPPRGSCSP
ncbi:SSPO protein, partial [Atlantisia rogersi]|nr:SSPO protein [Atlantisia rogersi]